MGMFTGEASKAAFESCDFTDAMDLGSMSPIEHKLTALPAYFACKVEDHCIRYTQHRPNGFGPMTSKVQPHFHASTAGGNYPLTEAPTDGSHAMCFITPDGSHTAYMGPTGTHPVQGDAASLLCPPEYHDLSAADGADCTTVPFHAGECADHGTHDHGTDAHPTSSPDHDDDGVIHVPWLAGFQDETARSKTAHVGDSLHFMWEGGGHNVYKMASKDAFDRCDFTDAVMKEACSSGATCNLGMDSPVEYTLTELPAYFACEIQDHCVQGQKLAVTAEM